MTLNLRSREGRFLAEIAGSQKNRSEEFHFVHFSVQVLNARSEQSGIGEVAERVFPVVGQMISGTLGSQDDQYFLELPISPEEKFKLAKVHLENFKDRYSGTNESLLWQTARDYKFVVQFGVTSPAVLLAQVHHTQPKTIQQRLYLARNQGLLNSFGRGRTQTEERN